MSEEDQDQLSFNLEEKKQTSRDDKKARNDENTLEWICHPAKRNMKVTSLVTIFLVVLIIVVYYTTYSLLFTGLAILILFGSLSAFYFPTRYRLTENEIRVKTTAQTLVKKWSQYRSFYPDKNGVLLSPFVRRTRMENFRGIYIKFEGNSDEVIAFVKDCMDKQKDLSEPGD
jgi:hypothetical protein